MMCKYKIVIITFHFKTTNASESQRMPKISKQTKTLYTYYTNASIPFLLCKKT